jgi:hypothetical protein
MPFVRDLVIFGLIIMPLLQGCLWSRRPEPRHEYEHRHYEEHRHHEHEHEHEIIVR